MQQPVVAIISNSLTPYRLHYHRRLIREAPGIAWHSLFTHDISNAPWGLEVEAEIRPVRFGVGERADDQSNLSRAVHEHRKGGRIINWLRDHHAAAVILLGYNDPGRIRIIRWCRRNRVPCFVFGDSNIKGDHATGTKAWIKRRALSRILGWTTGVLACGSLGRDYFRRYGVPDERIFLTPYEPDYDMIASINDQEVAEAYRNHRLNTERDYVMYCGRLVPVKRVDLVIDSFAAIADLRSGWDLLIVGDGPLHGSLESRVPAALKSRVHWLGFSGNQREVACLQRGAKVLVLPSDDEPWGVVINEAVAAGMAVVATDVVGAAAELVIDGVNGRLVPRNNLAALSEALADATSSAVLSKYRAASMTKLVDWRREGDPVAGVMTALASAGVNAQVSRP